MKALLTICTPSHLPQAKTLIDAALKYNPEYKAFIGLCKSDEYSLNELKKLSNVTVIDAEAINIPFYEDMKSRYNAFELSVSLKPNLADYIMATENPESLVFLDADTMVYGKIFEQEPEKDIVINDHLTTIDTWDEPMAVPYRKLMERNLLRAGTYNSGFFAVKNTPAGRKFLGWWKEVLIHGAYNNFAIGLFTDQLWLNLAPSFFAKDLMVMHHDGHNLAYWNLFQRKLIKKEGRYFVENTAGEVVPLVFFHYSGYRMHQPDIMTVHECPYNFGNRPELREMFDAYGKLVMENGYEEFRARYIPKPVKESIVKRGLRKIGKMVFNKK